MIDRSVLCCYTVQLKLSFEICNTRLEVVIVFVQLRMESEPESKVSQLNQALLI